MDDKKKSFASIKMSEIIDIKVQLLFKSLIAWET